MFRSVALRLVAVCVLLALAGALAPRSVAAAPNPPQPLSADFTLPPDQTGCAFDVHITMTGKLKFITLPDGSTRVVGAGDKATFTNVANGHMVTLGIAGTLRISSTADGGTTLVAHGENLWWGGAENALVVTDGQFAVTYAPDGSVTPITGTGHTTNVCALIA